MIAILTVLVALPLGLAIRSRTSAMLAYLSLYLWTYTFQTGYLTRAWLRATLPRSPGPRTWAWSTGWSPVPSACLAAVSLLLVIGSRYGDEIAGRSLPLLLDPVGMLIAPNAICVPDQSADGGWSPRDAARRLTNALPLGPAV